jgi:hypothetical protein
MLVSGLSGTVSSRERWLVDNRASFHMTGARELFDTLTETGSKLCVELGMGAKHSVRGSGTSIISIGVRRDTEGVKCVVGARTQEECPLCFGD